MYWMSAIQKVDQEGDRESFKWRGDAFLSKVVKEGITEQWYLV